MFNHKIIPFSEAESFFGCLRREGKTIVQCHGTFDLIHPGHIYHFEEAKSHGDVLVATVTAGKFVNKGPGRPFFNDDLRAKFLSSLGSVDYVVLIPFPTAVEAIECVRPHIYCKGREYEKPENDVTGNIYEDVSAVKKIGAKIVYVGSVVFSSTRILNNNFSAVSGEMSEFCRNLSKNLTPEQLRDEVDALAGLKVLVIGDIILDRYSCLKVQGLTSKNRIISGRFLREETQAGGSLAVYRHVKQFTSKVSLVGLVGAEPWLEEYLQVWLDPQDDWLVRDPSFTTVLKQRFVEPLSEGKELHKLFSVNYIDANPPSETVKKRILTLLGERIRDCDVVLAADFGHGFFHEEIRSFVEEQAPFFCLNCQTNSNNHGFNIINRQYRRANVFSLDEQELMLACGSRTPDFGKEMEALRQQLGAGYAWLTRGPVETLGLHDGEVPCKMPSIEKQVTDTVGAGDAFFSVASLAAARRMSVGAATFLGQLAGAQAVKIVGNAQPISKQQLVKSGMSLLNF